jgi:hypothetical protein
MCPSHWIPMNPTPKPDHRHAQETKSGQQQGSLMRSCIHARGSLGLPAHSREPAASGRGHQAGVAYTGPGPRGLTRPSCPARPSSRRTPRVSSPRCQPTTNPPPSYPLVLPWNSPHLKFSTHILHFIMQVKSQRNSSPTLPSRHLATAVSPTSSPPPLPHFQIPTSGPARVSSHGIR